MYHETLFLCCMRLISCVGHLAYDSDRILCDGRELALLWQTGKISLSYLLRLWLNSNYCQNRSIIIIISLLLNKSKTFSRSTWLTVIQGPLRSDMDVQTCIIYTLEIKHFFCSYIRGLTWMCRHASYIIRNKVLFCSYTI